MGARARDGYICAKAEQFLFGNKPNLQPNSEGLSGKALQLYLSKANAFEKSRTNMENRASGYRKPDSVAVGNTDSVAVGNEDSYPYETRFPSVHIQNTSNKEKKDNVACNSLPVENSTCPRCNGPARTFHAYERRYVACRNCGSFPDDGRVIRS